jgi:LysR family transcriptional regulator, transcriptional activator for bauABCD operon
LGGTFLKQLLHVDLRLLTILRTIVECRGLAKAQVVLGMSQSSVSAGLNELEERLGLRLCNRGRSGFSLTEAGRTVYEASHELFDSVARFNASTNAVSNATRGTLRIGTVDAIVTSDQLQLSEALMQFKRMTKNVLIDFLTGGPEELEALLLQGKRDIVIGPYTERYANLTYVPLYEEKQNLYLSKQHRLFDVADNKLTRETLSGSAFVSRRYLHNSDLSSVGHSSAQAVVDTMEAQLVLIKSGEYFGYLPEHYARSWVEQGDLRVLEPKAFSYNSPFYAVHLTQRIPNQLIKKFVSVLLDVKKS